MIGRNFVRASRFCTLNMLDKFLSGRKTIDPCRLKRPKQASAPPEKGSSALRIVHAGGLVESYYMAVPASRIMEKYPSFVLARPDVFRQPWNSLVQPDEILIPGQKFFVVPRRTIKKLHRRIKQPSTDNLVDSVDSESSGETTVQTAGSGKRTESEGDDSAIKASDYGDFSTAEISSEESPSASSGGLKRAETRRVRNIMAWKPSLFAIKES